MLIMSSGLIKLQKINKKKLGLARWMRNNMTPAEKKFWAKVKGNRLGGYHFRRQQIIHGFIADFYCEKLNLVVEIDGGIHEKQKDYDRIRDEVIERYGVRVMRFGNQEVMRDCEGVMSKILDPSLMNR